MMMIIKNGDLNKIMQIERFTCQHCGCVFEANKKEYQIHYQYNEEYLAVKCPFCNFHVYKEK